MWQAASVLQVIVPAVHALGWLPQPDGDFAGDVDCVEPCAPESLPPPELLPLVLPFLLLGLASLLGVALVVAALLRVARPPRRAVLFGLLLAVAPVLVLVADELVPHVVTPCWFGEVAGVCERTEAHGVDWAGDIQLLARRDRLGPVHRLGVVAAVPVAARVLSDALRRRTKGDT